jgi:hypothetical protein
MGAPVVPRGTDVPGRFDGMDPIACAALCVFPDGRAIVVTTVGLQSRQTVEATITARLWSPVPLHGRSPPTKL